MRIKYYDWLKSLAMFLVISFHSCWLRGTVGASVSMSLMPMAVPLFFMVHGALLLPRESTLKKQAARFGKTLLQLFGWLTIYLVISLLTGLIQPETVGLRFLFSYYFCKADSGGISVGHLWFIYALLVLYGLCPVFYACKKDGGKVLKYVMVACFVLSFLREETLTYADFCCRKIFGAPLEADWLWVKVGPYFNAVFWFLAGYYFTQWLPKAKLPRKRTCVALGLCGVVLGVSLLMLERYVVFDMVKYNWKPLPQQYEKLGTLVLAFSTFFLFSQLNLSCSKESGMMQTSTRGGRKNNDVLCWGNAVARTVSNYSLGIFYLHVIFIKYAYLWFYTWERAGVWQNYLRAAVVMALCWAVAWLLHKIPGVRHLVK